MENEYEYYLWRIIVNFLFFKKVNKHLHEVNIYDGYRRYFDKGVNPYVMSDILINNMENYIEGSGDSEEYYYQ